MQPFINIQDVVYQYPQARGPVLEGFSLQVEKGQIVFLLGANGCGKSTLFKLLMQELIPSSGKISIEGGVKVASISQEVHNNLFLDLTVQENLILMGVSFSTLQETENYLTSFHRNLFSSFHQPVKMLSGGEKQALILSLTLYHNPNLILFDEHTSAMDPITEEELMSLTYQKIKEHQTTALICTHKVDLARRYSTRLIGLSRGKVSVDLSHPDDFCFERYVQEIY